MGCYHLLYILDHKSYTYTSFTVYICFISEGGTHRRVTFIHPSLILINFIFLIIEFISHFLFVLLQTQMSSFFLTKFPLEQSFFTPPLLLSNLFLIDLIKDKLP